MRKKILFVICDPWFKSPTDAAPAIPLLILLMAGAMGGHSPNPGAVGFSREKSVVQAPQVGWLYVLDNRVLFERGQIIVVSPVNLQVTKRIPTGFLPDFTLSPDGSRLFVISSQPPSETDTLAVIDPLSTNVLDTQVVSHRMQYIARPGQTSMVVSADGRWLYIAKDRWTPGDDQKGIPQRDEYAVAMYDTQRRSFAKEDIPVSEDCHGMQLVPSSIGLHVLCSSGNEVYSYPLTPSGLGPPQVVALPRNPRQVFDGSPTTVNTTVVHPHIAGAVAPPDGKTLTVVTSYMRVIQIDAVTDRIARVEQVRDDRWAMPSGIPSSPDGARIYVPVGPLSQLNRGPGVNEILVLDAGTLGQAATIHTTGPFWSLTISKDGRYLYAVDPHTQTLYVIDAASGREVHKIAGLGAGPSRVAVGP